MTKNYAFPLFLALVYIIWALRATLFFSTVDFSIPEGPWRLVFSNLVKFILWVLPALAYVLWIDGKNPLAIMRINTRVNRHGLKLGAFLSLLFFVITFTVEYFATQRTLLQLLHAAPLELLATLAMVFISPISEELLFRGFVLPKLQESQPFWLSNLTQALLFTAMHWPNWLWTKGFQPEILVTSASIFILGVFLGWITSRTNSIWPGVGMHILNNFLVSFLR